MVRIKAEKVGEALGAGDARSPSPREQVGAVQVGFLTHWSQDEHTHWGAMGHLGVLSKTVSEPILELGLWLGGFGGTKEDRSTQQWMLSERGISLGEEKVVGGDEVQSLMPATGRGVGPFVTR